MSKHVIIQYQVLDHFSLYLVTRNVCVWSLSCMCGSTFRIIIIDFEDVE